MNAPMILAAVAVLSIGQTVTPKKNIPAPAKSDTWQRSKECASQAEKIMTELGRRGDGPTHWENHYSPKYDRCFVSANYMLHVKDGGGKDAPMFSTQLIDAFERSVLANSAAFGPTDGLCDIDDKPTTCAKAATFISEHMKN